MKKHEVDNAIRRTINQKISSGKTFDEKTDLKLDRDGLIRCRVCGCTEREPCNPPCSWIDVDLCSGCADAVLALAEWYDGAHRSNKAALFRELDEHMCGFVQRVNSRGGKEGPVKARRRAGGAR